MQQEKYFNNDRYYGKRNKKHFGKKSLIFLSFIFVLGFIFISAFYGNSNITGNVIGFSNSNFTLAITSNLTLPDISLKGTYNEVKIGIDQGIFNIGDTKIILDNSQNNLILKDFDGEIIVQGEKINKLKGGVSEVRLNNMPITLGKSGKIKILLEGETDYNSLLISEVSLKSLKYVASGEIYLDKTQLILDSEEIFIKNYQGSLNINEKRLILEGKLESLEIKGDKRHLILKH